MVAQKDTNTDVRTLLNSDQPIQIIGQVRDIEGKPVSSQTSNHAAIPEQQLVKPTTEFIVTDGDGQPIRDDGAKVPGAMDKAAPSFTCKVIDPDGKTVEGAMLLLSGADYYDDDPT